MVTFVLDNDEPDMNSNPFFSAFFPLALALILVVQTPLILAAEQDEFPVAHVIQVVGEAWLEREGEEWSIQRRDSIFVEDRLIVARDGHVLIRFADGAMIMLREESELRIAEYSYDSSPADRVRLELTRGALRTIVGEINNERYLLELPAATVVAEGGDFQVIIESPGEHSFAVFNEAITVQSSEGELRLGVRADFDFGEITEGSAPAGIYDLPGTIEPGIILNSPQ